MNCDRKWPSLDIFMPVNVISNRDHEYETIFLRSFLLFFPLKLSNVSLTVAIDIEHSESKQANELKRKFHDIAHRVPGGVKVALLPESEYYRSGYDRQQLVMFWADNFTSSEYVGFVDTDAAFITYVDREDLFEDGKPVVNGGAGYRAIKADGNWKWTVGTFVALGILEPFRCMTYFPVVIKVSHLPEIRDFISRYHNVSFNEAFYNNISSSRNYYSQFAIMCTYLFAFKRDEYKWYVHDITPEWDGKNPPPIFGQDGNISQFTTEMKLPKPRITVHAGYRRCLSNPIVSFFIVYYPRYQRAVTSPWFILISIPCSTYPTPFTAGYPKESGNELVSSGRCLS